MRQVVREFQQRAEQADFVAVIDDAGSHTARELLAEAGRLAEAMFPGGPGGTVLLQADNSWRTVAASLAVGTARRGPRGGQPAHHRRPSSPRPARTSGPDAVVAEPRRCDEWGVPELLPGPVDAVLDGWTCRAHARSA